MKVLITDNNLGDSALETEILERALKAEVFVGQCVTEQDVLDAVRRFQPAAMIVQWAPVTSVVIEALEDCKVISRLGIGLDMIDLEAANAAGIKVLNVPHYCTEEVATHAMSLILALNRRLTMFDRELRSGVWNAAPHAKSIKKLSESTLGLFGMGRIGSIVARAFSAFGGRVIAADPVHQDDGIERVPLTQLSMEADFISVHAPLLPETHHALDAAFFSSCKRAPIIVNTSRGAIIDNDALARALYEGEVSAAGIDVFEQEPLDQTHPLLQAPNTLFTPHAAWCSMEALPELQAQGAQNIVDFFRQRAVGR